MHDELIKAYLQGQQFTLGRKGLQATTPIALEVCVGGGDSTGPEGCP